MSYARWGWDNSDVYVFATIVGDGQEKLECCGCIDEQLEEPFIDMFGIEHTFMMMSFYADSPEEMIDHLNEHVENGDHVPLETFERIKEDYDL